MNIKPLYQLLKHSIYLLILPFMFACGGGETNNELDEDTSAVSEVQENLQQVLTDVPEPSEIPYQIQGTGADFDSKLPNPKDNAEKYMTTNSKAALNLGVYATDVGYVSVYEQVQNALDYVQAVESLGDKLDLSNAFDPEMQQRFKDNLSNIDTLTTIINEALAQSDKYLKDNERNTIAAFIFTGSFIEGLYISTQLVSTYPEDLLPPDAKDEVLLGMVSIITKQDKPLSDLINALKSLNDDEDIKKYLAHLEELAEIYSKLNIQEQIEKNQGDLILNDETIKGITKKVAEIRSEIVS